MCGVVSYHHKLRRLHHLTGTEVSAAAAASAKQDESQQDVHNTSSATIVAGRMRLPVLVHQTYHHHHPRYRQHFQDGDSYHHAKQAALLPVCVAIPMSGHGETTAMHTAALLIKNRHHQQQHHSKTKSSHNRNHISISNIYMNPVHQRGDLNNIMAMTLSHSPFILISMPPAAPLSSSS